MHVGGECEEHNVRSELCVTSQGSEVHREQRASASVSRTAVVAIWLVVVFRRRNVKCFLSASPSLPLIKQMDVSEAVCPSYQRVFCVDLWAKHPPPSLSCALSGCFDSCSHKLDSISPHTHTHPARSFSPQCLTTLKNMCTHTNTYTQTRSNRRGFVSVTWGELPHWEQQYWRGWMGLIVMLTGICPSGWLAWIRGATNPVSQTSVAVDAFVSFFIKRFQSLELWWLRLTVGSGVEKRGRGAGYIEAE